MSPRSSTHSTSSQTAKEEPHSSKDEKSRPSSGELSRRESFQKMNVLEMDLDKSSTSNGLGKVNGAARANEEDSEKKGVITTDF